MNFDDAALLLTKKKARVSTGLFRYDLSYDGLLPATAAAVAAAEAAATAATAAIATATAAAAAAEATAAARTSATATGAGTILRFIDAQRTTTHGIAVQRLDCAGRIFLRHFDKAETARTTRITIDR